MTEPTPEAELPPVPEPAAPEPTTLETVARLAAEAALRAIPDLGPRLDAAEIRLAEILDALAAAASPEGNAARLAARLDDLEQGLRDLADKPAVLPPEKQQQLDELRLKVATIERTKR